MLIWAREQGCPWEEKPPGRSSDALWDVHCCALAARGGHLTVLKWLRCGSSERILKEEHGPWSVSSDDGGSDVDVTPRACPWDEWTCANAAAGGHLEVLKWARVHGCHWEEDIFDNPSERDCAALAAEGGHLEVLKWLLRHHCESDDAWTFQCAAAGGHLKVLNWLCKHGKREHAADRDSYNMNSCARAARGGHLEVLKWLRKKGFRWDARTVQAATKAGHDDVLQWALANGCPKPRIVVSAEDADSDHDSDSDDDAWCSLVVCACASCVRFGGWCKSHWRGAHRSQ